MARTRQTVDVKDPPDPESLQDAEDLASLNQGTGGDLFSAIDELRTTGAGDVFFVVQRIAPVETKGYCGKVPLAKFDLEYLKATYGAGRYMVQIKGPKGFLPGGGPVEIAPTPEAPKEAKGDFSSYLELMERRDAERRASNSEWLKLGLASLAPVLAAWVARSPSQGTDIAALVTALKPAPGPGLADLTTAMVNMKNMTAPAQQDSKVDEILKIVEVVQNFAGDKEDGGKGGSSWIDIVRDLIKAAPDALKPMLEARMAAMQAARGGQVQQVSPAIQKPTGPAPVAPAPKPNPNPMPAEAPAGNANMLEMFMPLIKVNLSKVAGWAEKNRDPETYADVLVDELPDNFGAYIPLDDVFTYLNHPQWFETICGIEPRLQPHREWCDECRLAVIEIMKIFKTESEGESAPQAADTQGLDIPNTAGD